MRLDNKNIKDRFLRYDNLSTLEQNTEKNKLDVLKFANQRKLGKSIKFDGENVTVELKDTFKALQNVKRTYKNNDRNTQLRTPENSLILTKNGSVEPIILNGAGNGIRTHAYRNHNPRP